MKKKIFLIIIIVFLLCINFIVKADPVVSFTASSVGMKTVLTPSINIDVTHYKWDIIGKREPHYISETGWIPYDEKKDHISMLDNGLYIITITGKNTNTGLTKKFTNEVKVTVKPVYVEPSEEIVEKDIGSLIINSLPEPLKTFFSERSTGELLFIVLGVLLFIGIVTRRKKIYKYVKLERFHEK